MHLDAIPQVEFRPNLAALTTSHSIMYPRGRSMTDFAQIRRRNFRRGRGSRFCRCSGIIFLDHLRGATNHRLRLLRLLWPRFCHLFCWSTLRRYIEKRSPSSEKWNWKTMISESDQSEEGKCPVFFSGHEKRFRLFRHKICRVQTYAAIIIGKKNHSFKPAAKWKAWKVKDWPREKWLRSIRCLKACSASRAPVFSFDFRSIF